MTREETIEWIELVLDSLDDHETMAIIKESADQFDGAFFETMDSETERYEAAGDKATASQLTTMARAVAVVRQNRAENL